MNDPLSRQHVSVLVGHVVLHLVKLDVLVAVEYDTLHYSVWTVINFVVRYVLNVGCVVTPTVLAGYFQFQVLKLYKLLKVENEAPFTTNLDHVGDLNIVDFHVDLDLADGALGAGLADVAEVVALSAHPHRWAQIPFAGSALETVHQFLDITIVRHGAAVLQQADQHPKMRSYRADSQLTLHV